MTGRLLRGTGVVAPLDRSSERRYRPPLDTSHPLYCPPDQVPEEGQTIYSDFIHSRSKPDYVIDPETGCWVWQKFLLRGYPHATKGKPHRLYYERATGERLTPDIDVHHKCHNRACVNPDHLEAVPHGQHLERHRRGVSQLTEADVAEIRGSTATAVQMAAKYGVGRSLIRHIQTGQTWIGVGPARPEVYCGWCGARIVEGARHRRYCNPDHRVKANRRKARERADA